MCGAAIAGGLSKCPGCGESLASQAPKTRGVNLLTVLTVLGIGAILVALMLPNVRRARPAARRSQCKNNLKQIGLALHNYAQAYGALPPAYTIDGYGKPLHSWRTLILPYLDQRDLYEKIDLSKAWDDPVNAEACNRALPDFHCPSDAGPPNHTTYLACVASDGCFRPAEPRLLSEITDGLSNTLMVIEVPSDRAVPWMSPNDADGALILGISANSTLDHTGGTQAAFCDGSVRFLSADMPVAKRRAVISIAGGEPVDF